MSEQTFVALVTFIGFIFAGVLWLFNQQGKRLADALPPWATPIIIEVVRAGLAGAKTTRTPVDDNLLEKMLSEFEKRTELAVDSAAPQTAEELAARLNIGSAQG